MPLFFIYVKSWFSPEVAHISYFVTNEPWYDSQYVYIFGFKNIALFLKLVCMYRQIKGSPCFFRTKFQSIRQILKKNND